jgi:hypothetical protein
MVEFQWLENQTRHGGGTALGMAVTIPAKSPKTTLSGKIGRCTAAPMAVTMVVPPLLVSVSREKGRCTTVTMVVTMVVESPSLVLAN